MTMTSPAPAPAHPASEPILSLRGISKAFGAVQALTDVELDVFPRRGARDRR